MDRPLWRILLPILLLVVALHRAGLLAGTWLGEGPLVLAIGYAAEIAMALAAAVGLWLGRRWCVGALIGLGVALGAIALLEAFYVGIRPPASAVAELVIAALGSAALALAIRRELVAPARLGDADDVPLRGPTAGHPRREQHGNA